jgi:hypothetical protein
LKKRKRKKSTGKYIRRNLRNFQAVLEEEFFEAYPGIFEN